MRSRLLTSPVVFLALAVSVCSAQLPQNGRGGANYGKLPLTFEANQGQINSQVRFLSRGSGYTALLTSDGMVLSLRAGQVVASPAMANVAPANSPQRTTLQFRLLGATRNPAIVGEIPQIGRVNYFVGNNPAKWQRNVPTYAQVRYKNIYPGIDLLYYGNHRQLEYDFAVAPGADPGRIKFEIRGARKMRIDAEGNLVLTTSHGELHFQAPIVYQESNGQRVAVNGGYVVSDPTHISFQVAQYDPSKPLVIDPVLVYSTYLGGSGDDQPAGIAVDNAGNVYVAGSTDSIDFPLSKVSSLPAGNTHVFVAKLDPSGSNLIYADYLGGSNQDSGFALALDAANHLYVAGSTASGDFPMVHPFQGTYPGSSNAFLSKISADGSSLLYSTYFGGNGSDRPSSLAIDGSGNMVLAGHTSSTNLPVANAYQSSVSANMGGMYGDYGFVTKFSPDGLSLVYSTYIGGNSNVPLNCGGSPCWPQPSSTIAGMVLDAAGNAYLTGATNTYNFPVTEGAYLTTDSTQQNGTVGFVSKFSGTGSLQYSTYFYDANGFLTDLTAIAVDGAGSAYITGVEIGAGTFPITSTSICDPAVYGWGCNYAFVTKFDPAGATLLYSTFLGPNNNASPQGIVLDGNNDAYVLAFTGGGSFNAVNGIEGFSNGNDLLLVEIDATASTQLFATYLGGAGNDQPAPAGLALDANGNLYVTGTTDSTDFPVTQSAFQTVAGGNTDTFILKIGQEAAPAVALSPASLQYAGQAISASSQAQTVLLRNMGSSPLAISSITLTGDFSETDSCGNSVPAAGNCAVSVTFTPSASGSRTGTIAIRDDAAGSPHIITLGGIGLGAVAVVTPTSLTFPSVALGASSSSQVITLTNSGNAPMTISGFQLTGDYAQVNNCLSSLTAGSACTINVTFTPTATGARAGTLMITDSAPGSPQTIALTGTGSSQSASVTLSPASLVFTSLALGSSSAAQTVTLANNGSSSMSIASVQVSGDYSQTNNCPASLHAASTCAVSVTFAPTKTGTRSGTLTISDSATGSPQTAALSGTGSDFSLASSASSVTIKAGATAVYTLTVAPVGGAFSSAVKLSCSGAPATTNCSASPSSVTPGSSPATVTLTITTTAASAELVPLIPTGNHSVLAIWMQLPSLSVFGIMLAGLRRGTKKLFVLIALALLVGSIAFMSACAGGTGISSQGQPGTTPGTYTITVSGASGGLQHSVPLSLTVQ